MGIVDKSTPRSVETLMKAFCSLGPRCTTEQVRIAESFITGRLGELGMSPHLQVVPTRNSSYGFDTRFNVLSSYKYHSELKPLRVLFSAHYDTVSGTVGADDNASGVIALLELARLLSFRAADCVDASFAFFTNEEPPHFSSGSMGSSVFYRRYLKDPGKYPFDLVINVDCVGYFNDPGLGSKPADQGKEWGYIYGADVVSLGPTDVGYITPGADTVASGFFEGWNGPSKPAPIITGKDAMLGMLSDQRWVYGKVPAVHLTDMALTRNDMIHSPADTPDTLDYDVMANVVNGLYNSVVASGRRVSCERESE